MKSRKKCFALRNARMSSNELGFTLIETMISFGLGMIIIASALVMYASGNAANRFALEQSHMIQDAQTALDAISLQLARAGYRSVDSVSQNDLKQSRWSLFACDGQFMDVSEPLVNDLKCSESGNSSVAVIYDADPWYGKTASSGLPLDCVDNDVDHGANRTGRSVMQVRLFVESDSLKCLGGNLKLTPKIVAENIKSLSLKFEVADPKVIGSTTPVAHVTASEINAAPSDASSWGNLDLKSRWEKVLAVRVCVVVVSKEAVLRDEARSDMTDSYFDCSGVRHAIADSKMHMAYSTIVLIRSHGVGA